MSRFTRDMSMMFAGLALGAVLTCGVVAAGITAEPSWSPIYVDGQKVNMTAYNIAGNNYVKLRDIGQAVGFNVYYQNGVQVDSQSPYTGEAPVQSFRADSPDQIRIGSYKDLPLTVGDSSALMIYPSGVEYTVVSSDPSIVTVEKVLGEHWKANAVSPGTATVTATAPDGRTGSIEVTVAGGGRQETTSNAWDKNPVVDLTANMEIRREMIRLINETRKANGVAELAVNEALMNAAQDCSTKMAREHDSEYECKTAMRYGYPHGFGSNLTWFTGSEYMKNVAQTAVANWINSPGHFQTMVAERYDTIGVGVTVNNGQACCYMFVGNPNSHHPYE